MLMGELQKAAGFKCHPWDVGICAWLGCHRHGFVMCIGVGLALVSFAMRSSRRPRELMLVTKFVGLSFCPVV